MTRNARAQEKRSTLCHAGDGAAAGKDACDVTRCASRALDAGLSRESKPSRVVKSAGNRFARSDNFYARRESNAEPRAAGARFEAHALAFLRRQRLVLVARNVHCRGGELDLVMRDRDGTLVFVEVRARKWRGFGGAAASVGWHKQQRILRAAQYFLAARAAGESACERGRIMPQCRFDVVAFESGRLEWLRDAFRADDR
jgi:putative endonuclease